MCFWLFVVEAMYVHTYALQLRDSNDTSTTFTTRSLKKRLISQCGYMIKKQSCVCSCIFKHFQQVVQFNDHLNTCLSCNDERHVPSTVRCYLLIFYIIIGFCFWIFFKVTHSKLLSLFIILSPFTPPHLWLSIVFNSLVLLGLMYIHADIHFMYIRMYVYIYLCK